MRAAAIALALAACHGEAPPVVEPPQPPPPPAPADAAVGESLKMSPANVLDAAAELEDVQHLELARGPWREVAVVRRTGEYDLVLATPAGRFVTLLDQGMDGLAVDELALHALVRGEAAWVVVVYDSVRDGGKRTSLVACGLGRAGHPRCTEPVVIQNGDLRDELLWHIDYPASGGIVLSPIGSGATPRHLTLSE